MGVQHTPCQIRIHACCVSHKLGHTPRPLAHHRQRHQSHFPSRHPPLALLHTPCTSPCRWRLGVSKGSSRARGRLCPARRGDAENWPGQSGSCFSQVYRLACPTSTGSPIGASLHFDFVSLRSPQPTLPKLTQIGSPLTPQTWWRTSARWLCAALYCSLARTPSRSALYAASLALGVSTTSQLRSSFVILGAVALNGVKGAVAVVGLP